MAVCAGDAEGGRPRPAFRPVRRLGAEPDQRADRGSSAICTTRAGACSSRVSTTGCTRSPNAQAAQWDELGFDEAGFLGGIGLSAPAGERGSPPLERLWARPTADINGIWGGYTGAGSKTVIAVGGLGQGVVPSGAEPGPGRGGRRRSRRFFAERAARRMRRSTSTCSARARGSRSIPRQPLGARGAGGAGGRIRQAGGADGHVAARSRWWSRSAGMLGIDSLLMGFGLDDDQVHSPNEKFEMRCFHHGIRSHARLLGKMAALG